MFWRRHAVRDDDLSAYVDGQLDTAARERIETHLEACSACRETLAELRELRSAVQALPRVTAPRSFALREADVRPESAAAPAGSFARAVPMLGGVTAVAVLTFFVLLGFDVSGPTQSNESAFSGPSELASFTAQQESNMEADATADESTEANRGLAMPAPASGDAETPAAPGAEGEALPKGAIAGEDGGAGAPAELEPAATPGTGDGWPAVRVAEAAAAGVALAAGASLALVWWRRRT